MAKIGVYLCSCGGEIANRIDFGKLAKELGRDADVVLEHAQLCSPEGLEFLEQSTKEHGLDRVMVAACAQDLYDVAFLPALQRRGVDPHRAVNLDLLDAVSLRNLAEREEATKEAAAKAREMLRRFVAAEEVAAELPSAAVQRALVIGGGIGGIQAALDIANAGYEVVLVEREPSIGGKMIQLSETFPTLDCSQCILTPKMVDAGSHPNITLKTYSEVQEITGSLGQFKVKILRKPRYVTDDCTACGDCVDVCPVVVTDQFNTGLRWRKAIYQPCPQAVPATYALDEENCLGLLPLACGKCKEACEPKTIDYDMRPEVEEIEVGAVVVATGYELFTHANVSEYGLGKYANVLNGLQFERLLSASGPTMGKVLRPSDDKEPKNVVFIQCVRSRDPEKGMPYCSGICCMYTAKHAMLYKHRVHDGAAQVFYMDVRAGGKGYEEFVKRAQDEGVDYVRGRVSRIFETENHNIMVWGMDTLTGKKIEVEADMVVLATAIVANDGHEEIRKVLRLDGDEHGFLREAHEKIHPLQGSIPGFFLVGCCQGPRDIPDTVAQASGAAAKVCALFAAVPVLV
jgi:heterodisulfide reductase subunit A